MKAYIGAKIILAEPQEKDGKAGYKVRYSTSYESWSPKEVFEEAYRLISEVETKLMFEPLPEIPPRHLPGQEMAPKELPPLGIHVTEDLKFREK